MCPAWTDPKPLVLSAEISEASEVLFMFTLLFYDTEMEAVLCHEMKFCPRYKARLCYSIVACVLSSNAARTYRDHTEVSGLWMQLSIWSHDIRNVLKPTLKFIFICSPQDNHEKKRNPPWLITTLIIQIKPDEDNWTLERLLCTDRKFRKDVCMLKQIITF